MKDKGTPLSSVKDDAGVAPKAPEQHSLKESSKWKSWDLRWAVRLKVVQCGAYIAAGVWVLLSAYLLYKKEATRRAAYGCFAKTTLRVDQIPGGDGQKSLYLVTVDTLVRNETDRWVSISNYTLDFYVGKTLAGPSPGFFVPPPTLKLGHPTIDWKHFGRHAQQFVDEQIVGQIHDNKDPKKNSEPIANSNESSSRLETSGFFRLPAGQSWTFEDQFVISASENDWIATDSILIHDKGLAYKEGDIPETRVENIAVALRRGSEIAPKSLPLGSNPAPR
jgi:hypothetical protein